MPSPLPVDVTARVQRASDLAAEPVPWLWPGWLALGKLSILDGDPGLGKSLITLDLAARLTNGRPFPDGSAGAGPGNVLLVNAEDGAADTILPRLRGLEADLARVFLIQAGTTGLEPLRLPNDLGVIAGALRAADARLLVLDPITAFLDRSVQSANDPSVRRALTPLGLLAEHFRCAPLLVRHLNKRADQRALYRGGGSIAFVGVCRSAWLVAADPQQPQRRVLAQTKNNLAGPQPSLVYEVAAQADGTLGLTWHGSSERTADGLLARPARLGRRPTIRQQVCDRLETFLRAGPRMHQEVEHFVKAEGLPDRTLRRAKESLCVRSVRAYREGVPTTWWLLPGQELPSDIAPEDVEVDLAELLKGQAPEPPLMTRQDWPT